MRKFVVIAVLAALTWLFVAQKRSGPEKAVTTKSVAQVSGSPTPRPASEHNWMKRSLDRTNEVKRQVAEQRKTDGTR
jgi:hypothetical protein